MAARFAVLAAVAYVIAYEPIVPFFPDRNRGGGSGEDLLTLLPKTAALGAAAGYLLAIWRERGVLPYLAMGFLYGALLGLATPLILIFIGYLIDENLFDVL